MSDHIKLNQRDRDLSYSPTAYTGDDAQSVSTYAAWLIIVIVLAGMFYNAGLSFINIKLFAVNGTLVAISEMAVLGMAVLMLALNWQKSLRNLSPIFFALPFVLLFLWVSFFNESTHIKPLRDIALISIFLMLGALASKQNILTIFRISTSVIVAGMVMEAYATELYVSLFNPAKYYLNTRGFEEFEYSSVDGLFVGATAYAGRFSFGIFDTHRLSSLFLEQVSLANFAVILAIFTSSFWNSLKHFEKLLFPLAVAFILVTNNSRSAAIIVALIAVGHFIFPLLPSRLNLVMAPLLLIMTALAFYNPNYAELQDNLAGRLGLSLHYMSEFTLSDIFTGNIKRTFSIHDSGFSVFILSHTLLGMAIFWAYLSTVINARNSAERRLAFGMNSYIWLVLLTSASIFSIKTSAPLWIMVGYAAYARRFEVKPSQPQTRSEFIGNSNR